MKHIGDALFEGHSPCKDFTIYKQKSFHPIHSIKWQEYFNNGTDSKKILEEWKKLNVLGAHVWNKLSDADKHKLYYANARRILGLKPLDPLEAELGAAERGSALHKTLDKFLKAHPSGMLPPGALQEFEALGEQHLAEILAAPAERAFWWPRFQRLARWFVATENARRAEGARLLDTETKGSMTVGPDERPLVIEAIADRIDQVEPGTWEVIDYKTGDRATSVGRRTRTHRLGTFGSLSPAFAPGDLLCAAAAIPHDGASRALVGGEPHAPLADFEIVHAAVHVAKGLGVRMRVRVAEQIAHVKVIEIDARDLPASEFLRRLHGGAG